MIRIIPKIIKDNDNVRVYMLDGEIKYWGENENKVQEEVIIL